MQKTFAWNHEELLPVRVIVDNNSLTQAKIA